MLTIYLTFFFNINFGFAGLVLTAVHKSSLRFRTNVVVAAALYVFGWPQIILLYDLCKKYSSDNNSKKSSSNQPRVCFDVLARFVVLLEFINRYIMDCI